MSENDSTHNPSTRRTERTERYNPHELEPKWRKAWEDQGIYRYERDSKKPKHYALTMFPYPSGNLHIGHWYAFAAPDTRARWMRMNGYNVLFPMGFDAFGLPAENAAIKRQIDPGIWTRENIKTMTEQFKRMGTMIDWSARVVTCEADYYRWNQWFFVHFFRRGLAYKKESFVNWDPVDQTVLANEQVINGRGERSGAIVERRLMSQWHLRITDYAEELLNFDGLEWPEKVKLMQTNWIGKSTGAEVRFSTPQGPISVFTTRPDTLWGTTFLVLAPEHPLVEALAKAEHAVGVQAYVEAASHVSEIERQAEDRKKTGVWLGSYAINPATGNEIPIWISDYVLVTYGTGAIMAVPAHDERDFAFAKTHNLPIQFVVAPDNNPDNNEENMDMSKPWPHGGWMVNSGPLNGVICGNAHGESIDMAIRWLEGTGNGQARTTYRLRDWLISRQRYWGTPIPIVYCPHCGPVPVPENELPIRLPEGVTFLPTGQSPLTLLEDWKKTTCPSCGAAAERETDTMDTFVDSSWYFYRYLDPSNNEHAINKNVVDHWMPVDWYTGGIEHAILHLLYARFWTKAMRDMQLVDCSEPFTRLMNQGIILGEDNEKMSKSRGNVVDPDDLVSEYGTDTVRLYLQFIGPWDQGGPWAPKGVNGIYNWLARIWSLFFETPNLNEPLEQGNTSEIEYAVNMALKKVSEDTTQFKFNTAIAAMMELSNFLGKAKRSSEYGSEAWQRALKTFNLMLAPYAPHLAEELWHRLGHTSSVHLETWPSVDETKLTRDTFELVVQISGKVRGRIQVPLGASQDELIELARSLPNIQAFIEGKEIVKEIFVPGRLVNIVVK